MSGGYLSKTEHLAQFLIDPQWAPESFDSKRNTCDGCSVLQNSGAESRLLENAIDSRMRIKAITISDLEQKPCQFYWHGLLQITIVRPD